MSHKKIVITGASGFLGSHLVGRMLGNEQYEVYALSSKPEQLKEKIGGENIIYCHKDDINAEILKDSIVISCAYPRNFTGTAIADGLKYIQTVLERSVESKAAAIINISSQSVYSQQRTEAATEETELCLENSYAVGKYAVELMLESICKGSGTIYTNLRMASLIGPGFDQRIVNRFVKQAVETGKLTVKMNQQRFGFFDVEDAVSAIILMLDTDIGVWKPVYNLGRNGSHSLAEIAKIVHDVVLEIYNKEIKIESNWGDETGNSELNADLFRKDFKLERLTSLRESVTKIVFQDLNI